MATETVRYQHPNHFVAGIAASTTTSELDLLWATKDAGGINAVMWDQYGHYHGKPLRRMYLDRRVALGGAKDVSPD